MRLRDRDRAELPRDKRGAGVSLECLQIRHEVVDVLVGQRVEHVAVRCQRIVLLDRDPGSRARTSASRPDESRSVTVKSFSSTSTPDTAVPDFGVTVTVVVAFDGSAAAPPRPCGGRGKTIRCWSSIAASYFLPMPARSPVAEWHVRSTSGAVEVGFAGLGIAGQHVARLENRRSSERVVDALPEELRQLADLRVGQRVGGARRRDDPS